MLCQVRPDAQLERDRELVARNLPRLRDVADRLVFAGPHVSRLEANEAAVDGLVERYQRCVVLVRVEAGRVSGTEVLEGSCPLRLGSGISGRSEEAGRGAGSAGRACRTGRARSARGSSRSAGRSRAAGASSGAGRARVTRVVVAATAAGRQEGCSCCRTSGGCQRATTAQAASQCFGPVVPVHRFTSRST